MFKEGFENNLRGGGKRMVIGVDSRYSIHLNTSSICS